MIIVLDYNNTINCNTEQLSAYQTDNLSVFCLKLSYLVPQNHNIADEIEQMLYLCSSTPPDIESTSTKICEMHYQDDSNIIEFDIAIAAPKVSECFKACGYMLSSGNFPPAIECAYTSNLNNELNVKRHWLKEYVDDEFNVN